MPISEGKIKANIKIKLGEKENSGKEGKVSKKGTFFKQKKGFGVGELVLEVIELNYIYVYE